ncbi:hypothetical protein [Tsuneonella amylolytica]|uniref:hypothetical protein n=1 Tax=Tsuneonella amylolytica TaxID=2338327 RepID=UPI000EA8CC43|nr:hypothetical protein [Tsuneonella amylolytica]
MARGAALFFARDFLATEFPRMAEAMRDRPRVYIVLNEQEAATVASLDPEGEIERVGAAHAQHLIGDDGSAVARDRTLRYASLEEIDQVRRAVQAVTDAVLARHPRPSFYFDEPVSGFANEMFNARFKAAGALCLHFQTAWVPGYIFFTSDKGQDEPIRLDLMSGGRALTEKHIESRALGKGLPHYMLSYGKVGTRARDMATTFGKAMYRKFFRRHGTYVDRDIEAHLFHSRALRRSLTGRYSPDPVSDAGGAAGTEAGRKLVLFPLHYEPESLLTHFSTYYRQEDIAARLLDSLPPDARLVIKEHPSQPGALLLPKWRDLVRAKRVIALPGNYPASRLFALKPTIASLGSTLALEAAVAGCPTGVMGSVYFADAPGITRIARPEDWPQVTDTKPATHAEMADWYGDFLDRYCFAGNLMRGKTWIEDPDTVFAALDRVATNK